MVVLISLRTKSISMLTTNHFFPSLSREFFLSICIEILMHLCVWDLSGLTCDSFLFLFKNTGLKKCSQVRILTYIPVNHPLQTSSDLYYPPFSLLSLSLPLSLTHVKMMFPSRQLSGRCCSKDLSLLSSKRALVWWWNHRWIEEKRYPHCLWIGTNWAVSVVYKTW